MKDIRDLTNGMWSRKNVLLPNVWVYEINNEQQSNTFKLSLVYDGKEQITEEFMNNIYRAYYDYLVRNGIDFNDPSYHNIYMGIKSLYITCGIKLSYVHQYDILSPSINTIPTYVRHYYTIPSEIKQIPSNIFFDSYLLPSSSVEYINKIITTLLAQEKSPGKYKIHFNMIKKGTLEVKTVPFNEKYTVSYEIPSEHNLSIRINPNNFRVEGFVMLTPKMPLMVTLETNDEEKGTDTNLDTAILNELSKRLHLNKLKLHLTGMNSELIKYNYK